MQPRFLTLFGLVALLAVFVVINAEEEDENVVEVEEVEDRANPAAKIVAKMIGSLFVGAVGSCLMEAASQCQQHWKHAHAAMQCAKSFLANNRGRCAAG